MKKIVVALTVILILLFASISAAGGYMVYQEVFLLKEKQVDPTSGSNLIIGISKGAVSFKITNAVPGLIIFCLGIIGLIVMTFKIPVHEVLGYEVDGSSDRRKDLTKFITDLPIVKVKKVLSEQTIQTPLLVWWLLKGTEKLEKV